MSWGSTWQRNWSLLDPGTQASQFRQQHQFRNLLRVILPLNSCGDQLKTFPTLLVSQATKVP